MRRTRLASLRIVSCFPDNSPFHTSLLAALPTCSDGAAHCDGFSATALFHGHPKQCTVGTQHVFAPGGLPIASSFATNSPWPTINSQTRAPFTTGLIRAHFWHIVTFNITRGDQPGEYRKPCSGLAVQIGGDSGYCAGKVLECGGCPSFAAALRRAEWGTGLTPLWMACGRSKPKRCVPSTQLTLAATIPRFLESDLPCRL